MGKITFWHLLGLLFLYLKLTGYIDWHWWWILSPLTLHYVSSFLAMIHEKGKRVEQGERIDKQIKQIEELAEKFKKSMEGKEK